MKKIIGYSALLVTVCMQIALGKTKQLSIDAIKKETSTSTSKKITNYIYIYIYILYKVEGIIRKTIQQTMNKIVASST